MIDKVKGVVIRPIESIFDIVEIWASLADIGLLFALFGLGLNVFSIVLIPIAVFAGYQIAKQDGNEIKKTNQNSNETYNQAGIDQNKAKLTERIEKICLVAIPIVAAVFLSPIILIAAPILGALVGGLLFGAGYIGYVLYRNKHPKDIERINETASNTQSSSSNSISHHVHSSSGNMVFCINCGKKISSAAKFCMFCGESNKSYKK